MQLTDSINISNFTLDDIIVCLNNTGYYDYDSSEFEFAYEHNLIKYIGYYDNSHRFIIGFYDEDDEYYVSLIGVFLGQNMKICADYQGIQFVCDTCSQLIKRFEEYSINDD